MFKTGMIYRSKTHPQFDLIIDFVSYNPNKLSKYGNVICWCNINRTEFNKFIDDKLGKNRETTYPYPYAGECSIKSMKQRLKKYNLKFVETSKDKVVIFNDDEFEYCSGFKEKCSTFSL